MNTFKYNYLNKLLKKKYYIKCIKKQMFKNMYLIVCI